MPALLFTILLVVVVVSISLALLFIVRRLKPEGLFTGMEVRVATAVFTVSGSLFGLLLAFIVVTVWQNYHRQWERTIEEAVALGNLYRHAGGMKQADSQAVRAAIRRYTETIINDSWPKLARGEESELAGARLHEVRELVYHYVPAEGRETAIYEQILRSLDELHFYRRVRIFGVRSALPRLFWFVLVSGAAVTIAFTFILSIKSARAHALLVAFYSGLVTLNLALVLLLNYPYRSSIRISHEPFLRTLTLMDQLDRTKEQAAATHQGVAP